MIHIALLRAVNLAGKRSVAMADLRRLCDELGYGNARTLLQSGNLVFESARTPAALEAALEKAVTKSLGLEVEFFVRTAKEWAAIVEANPFTAEARRDPGHLLLMLLEEAPAKAAVAELQRSIAGREVVRAGTRHLYAYYPDGVGRSKLTNAAIEKRLGGRTTGRNWNTVLKLGGLV